MDQDTNPGFGNGQGLDGCARDLGHEVVQLLAAVAPGDLDVDDRHGCLRLRRFRLVGECLDRGGAGVVVVGQDLPLRRPWIPLAEPDIQLVTWVAWDSEARTVAKDAVDRELRSTLRFRDFTFLSLRTFGVVVLTSPAGVPRFLSPSWEVHDLALAGARSGCRARRRPPTVLHGPGTGGGG
jgi:hypothetical protein